MRVRLKAALMVAALLALTACNLTTEPPATPTPPPDIPVVEFLYPPNESTALEGAEVEIGIAARDNGIGIARVQLLVDDQPVNERGPEVSAAVPVFTVTMNWLAQGQGRHVLTAIAYRPDDTPSDPATMLLNVLPPDGDLQALTAQPATPTP